MDYPENITKKDLKHYFQNFTRDEQWRWYARVQKAIGHDSDNYDFRSMFDVKLYCMWLSGDRYLTVQHEDENYIIYRSHDTGIIVDIFLNKKTGQHTAIEVYSNGDNAINI